MIMPATPPRGADAAAALDALVGQLLTLTTRAGLDELPTPAPFHLRSSWAGEALTITPVTFSSPDMPLLRVVRVDGGSRVQVLNIVAFPSISSGLPIFGCELLCFAKGLHLFVLDAFPVAQGGDAGAATRQALRDARASLPEALLAREVPAWGAGVFSPETILIKPAAAGPDAPRVGVDAVGALAVNVFKIFIEDVFFKKTPKASERRVDKARLKARKNYLHIHATEEPAGPFLTRIAGEAWVRTFVTQLLYPEWLHEHDRAPPWRATTPSTVEEVI